MARLARRLAIPVAILGFVVGFAVFILGFVLTLGDNDKYGKVDVPGEGRVDLPEGEVILFYEERANLPSESNLDVPGELQVRVRSLESGEVLSSEPAGNLSAYQYNSLDGTSVARLDVEDGGEHGVVARLTSPRGAPDKAITFGPGLEFGKLALRTLTIMGAGLLAAALLALIGRAARRPPPTARVATAPGTPPPAPTPQPAAPAIPLPDPPAPAAPDPEDELRQLEESKRRGAVTPADYAARRKEILDRL